MKRILIVFAVVLGLAACSKDKFKTAPTVTIDSFGPAEVTNGNHFELRATVTDKEGDVQDSIILVRKKYVGSLVQVDSTAKNRFSLKDLGAPVKDKIELQIRFVYGRIEDGAITQDLESDFDREISIGLIVIDNAGHRSDYVESNRITLKKFQ